MSHPVDITMLPIWVKWLAQDANGQWWGYEYEPQEFDKGWYENEAGRYQILTKTPPNPAWRQSLIRIQQNNNN